MEREGRDGESSTVVQGKEGKREFVKNPHIAALKDDILYHLALGSASHDLRSMFSDVKYVCMGGTPRRMQAMAHFLKDQLQINLPTGCDICDVSQRSYRYSLFKIGPIITVSHGMGVPSLSILLHEIIKLVHHAKCKDVTFVRIGTSGGIGLAGGTLVISKATVDSRLKAQLKLHVLGNPVKRPAILDKDLADELYNLSRTELPNYKTVLGKTMCTNDFYEGQGRLDGAFCDYTATDKMTFLRRIHEAGVSNIEMESLGFAAMCHHAGIKCAVICVTLLDRLKGDQIHDTRETLEMWQRRPQELVAKFIMKREMK